MEKKALLAAVVFLVLVFAAAVRMSPAQGNPLKEEMRLLDAAYKGLIDAVILNNPGRIEEDFEKVHAARARTEEALEKGEISLPKNNERISDFAKMDGEFHMKVEELIGLAKKKDMGGIRKISHEMLDACVSCHTSFRQ